MTEAAAPTAEAATAPANPDAGGLLDNVKPIADGPKAGDGADATAVSHMADDPTAAAQAAAVAKGQKPEWLSENFWDKEKGEPRIEQLAKSWADLRKQVSLGKHKAPDGGKYALDVIAGKVPEDDPLVKEVMAWGGKYGVPQAAFDEIMGKVVEMGMAAETEVKVSRTEEMAKLGPQANAIIESMVGWAQKLVSSGVWSGEDFEEFKVMGGTAQGMRAMMKLRESYEGRLPLKDTTPSEIGMSDEELHAQVGDPRYLTDPVFRGKVEKMFEQRYGGRAAA